MRKKMNYSYYVYFVSHHEYPCLLQHCWEDLLVPLSINTMHTKQQSLHPLALDKMPNPLVDMCPRHMCQITTLGETLQH